MRSWRWERRGILELGRLAICIRVSLRCTCFAQGGEQRKGETMHMIGRAFVIGTCSKGWEAWRYKEGGTHTPLFRVPTSNPSRISLASSLCPTSSKASVAS